MKVLISGGAGFIGSNSAEHFLKNGDEVFILDNLSRKGAEANLKYLKTIDKDLNFYQIDIRNFDTLTKFFKSRGPFDLILHLAAQVAVTTSVLNPREDFQINAIGTFNMLEATRKFSQDAFFINASTNKVYGKMERVEVVEKEKRYDYKSLEKGVDENMPLDFHSPYGCSKGAADQYTIDYGRIYGLKTVSMRQSCIYGERQFGVEDQGWIAWFIIAALSGKKITIYGNGKQVRDVLHVKDLVDCYLKAYEKRDIIKGNVFNIGGGIDNNLSLLEFFDLFEEISGKKTELNYSDWRPGDQPIFISNIEKAEKFLNWTPKISPKKGIESLFNWVKDNLNDIKEVLG